MSMHKMSKSVDSSRMDEKEKTNQDKMKFAGDGNSDSEWTDISDDVTDTDEEEEDNITGGCSKQSFSSTPVKTMNANLSSSSLSEEEKQNFAFISEQLSILNKESQATTDTHKLQKKHMKKSTPTKSKATWIRTPKKQKMSVLELNQRKAVQQKQETTPTKKNLFDDGSADDADTSQDALHIDEQDFDETLDRKAKKKGLTAINVKNIIHELVKSVDVQQMLRNHMNEQLNKPSTSEGLAYEPKMTRAKVKEVIELGVPLQTWPLSPVKKTTAPKKPSILEIEFPDDEEDDEYSPDKDAEAQHESDDDVESMLSSHASDLGSPLPPTPSTPTVRTPISATTPQTCDSEVFRSPASTSSRISGVGSTRGSMLAQHFKSSMAALEDSNTQASETQSDTIARRTRSKLPLTDTSLTAIEEAFVAPDITPDMYDTTCDDSDWQNFLRSLIKSDVAVPVEDDANDPEYDYLEEEQKVQETEEDFRFDKPFRIPKKEYHQLITDVDYLFPEPDEEDRTLELEESTMHESVEDPVEVNASVNRKELEDNSLIVSPEERLLVEDQMRKHVQLTTQLFFLCKGCEDFEPMTANCRQLLREVDIFRCISSARDMSSYNVCNLQGALALVGEDQSWDLNQEHDDASSYSIDDTNSNADSDKDSSDGNKKHKKKYSASYPLLPSQVSVFWNSPVFLYPHLLPRQRLVPLKDMEKCRIQFTAAEDNLIALGYEQFHKMKHCQDMIQKYLLPAKTARQIKLRMKNLCSSRFPDNPLKYFKKHKKAFPRALVVEAFHPDQVMPPKDRDNSVLPKWARRRRLADGKTAKRPRKHARKRSSSLSLPLSYIQPADSAKPNTETGASPAKTQRSAPTSPLEETTPRRSVEDTYDTPKSSQSTPRAVIMPEGVFIPFKLLNPGAGPSQSTADSQSIAQRLIGNNPGLGGSIRILPSTQPGEPPRIVSSLVTIPCSQTTNVSIQKERDRNEGNLVSQALAAAKSTLRALAAKPVDIPCATVVESEKVNLDESGLSEKTLIQENLESEETSVNMNPNEVEDEECADNQLMEVEDDDRSQSDLNFRDELNKNIQVEPCDSNMPVEAAVSLEVGVKLSEEARSEISCDVNTQRTDYSHQMNNSTVLEIQNSEVEISPNIPAVSTTENSQNVERVDNIGSENPVDQSGHVSGCELVTALVQESCPENKALSSEIQITGKKSKGATDIISESVNKSENTQRVTENNIESGANISKSSENVTVSPVKDLQNNPECQHEFQTPPKDNPPLQVTPVKSPNPMTQSNTPLVTRTALDVIAAFCPYYTSSPDSSSSKPPTPQQELMEKTPTKRQFDTGYRELRPKPCSLNDNSVKVSPLLAKVKSPKRVLRANRTILPKSFVLETKESPTKRAARSLRKRAQMICQRTSPCKLAPQSEIQRLQRLQLCPLAKAAYMTRSRRKQAVPTRKLRPSFQRMNSESDVSDTEDEKGSESVNLRAGVKRKLSEGERKEESDGQSEEVSQEESQNEEDVEDSQSNDQNHLDILMAASTTLGFGRKKISVQQEKAKGKNQKKKEQTLAMLAPDLLEMDPKRDEKDTAFAQAYLDRVRDCLTDNLELFEEFLSLMYTLGKKGVSAVQVYEKLQVMFKDLPELLEDFAGFLLPEQAVQCGCFMKQQEIVHARTFLRKLEVNYENQPNHFQRILKVLSSWYQNPQRTAEDLKSTVKPLLKGMPHLLEEFSIFFPEERPPESNMNDFECLTLSDSDFEDGASVESFEEVDFPDDVDTYRTKWCGCKCHHNPQEIKLYKRLKHCINCSLKVIDGKLYFQPSRNKLYPAKVMIWPTSPAKSVVSVEDEGTDDKENVASFTDRPTVISPSTTHSSPARSKKIKLKISRKKAGEKRFLTLCELGSPSKMKCEISEDGVADEQVSSPKSSNASRRLSPDLPENMSSNIAQRVSDNLIVNPPATLQANILEHEKCDSDSHSNPFVPDIRSDEHVAKDTSSAVQQDVVVYSQPSISVTHANAIVTSTPEMTTIIPQTVGFVKISPEKGPSSPLVTQMTLVPTSSPTNENSNDSVTVSKVGGAQIVGGGGASLTIGSNISALSGPASPLVTLSSVETPSTTQVPSTVSRNGKSISGGTTVTIGSRISALSDTSTNVTPSGKSLSIGSSISALSGPSVTVTKDVLPCSDPVTITSAQSFSINPPVVGQSAGNTSTGQTSFPNLVAGSMCHNDAITLNSGQQLLTESTPSTSSMTAPSPVKVAGEVPSFTGAGFGMSVLSLLDGASLHGDASQTCMSDILAKAMKTADICKTDAEVSMSVDLQSFLANFKLPESRTSSPMKNPSGATSNQQNTITAVSLQEQLIKAGIISRAAASPIKSDTQILLHQPQSLPVLTSGSSNVTPPRQTAPITSRETTPPLQQNVTSTIATMSSTCPKTTNVQSLVSDVPKVTAITASTGSPRETTVLLGRGQAEEATGQKSLVNVEEFITKISQSSSPQQSGSTVDETEDADKLVDSAKDLSASEECMDVDEDMEVEWTKDMDKLILEVCKRSEPVDDTFVKIAEKLKIVTPNEVAARFDKLMQLFSSIEDESEDDSDS